MQFAFHYPKDINFFFWKTIDFVKNLEMTQIAGGRGFMYFTSLQRSGYENWFVFQP